MRFMLCVRVPTVYYCNDSRFLMNVSCSFKMYVLSISISYMCVMMTWILLLSAVEVCGFMYVLRMIAID